jgi:hypothetical protein
MLAYKQQYLVLAYKQQYLVLDTPVKHHKTRAWLDMNASGATCCCHGDAARFV